MCDLQPIVLQKYPQDFFTTQMPFLIQNKELVKKAAAAV